MATYLLSEIVELIEQEKDRFVAAVVHLNDTYLIEERAGRLPGFPRVIATIEHLRAEVARITQQDNRVLVLHSGDFIGPSLLSNHDRGAAMAELLQRAGLDYCLPGNHEFDYGAENLGEQLKGRRFKLLCANSKDPTGLVTVQPRAEWHGGSGPLIALTGVVSRSVWKSFRSPESDEPFAKHVRWDFEPANEALIRFLEETKDIPFRIVLSHATQAEDRELRRQLPSTPRTYIFGGHDHDIEWIEDDRDVLLMKNLANLETVRIVVLLAGGESVIGPVVDRALRLGQRRAAAGQRAAPVEEQLRYPQDVEPLLSPVHDRDREVVVKRLSDVFGPKGRGPLWDAIVSLNHEADIKTWKLRYADHCLPAQGDHDYVKNCLAAMPNRTLDVTVRDFTAATGGQPMEARESRIRRRQTDFGGFVAECVRLHGRADVAIVNSGAFRSDSLIGPHLQVRDILEAFLYDKTDAVITLEVDSRVADALLVYAASRLGQGAYCQVRDDRQAGSSTVVVAIAKYLVADERSIDGFDAVLAHALGLPDETAARDWAARHIQESFSVVDAVIGRAHAAHLGSPGIAATQEDLANDLIEGLKAYADKFFDGVQSEDATGRAATQRERDRLFEEWLGSDVEIPLPTIGSARDAVRKILRALPAVSSASGARDLSSIEAAADELAVLRAVIGGHDFNFRDRADYAWMFDLASRGISGAERG